MEKDIDKITKNPDTDIIIRVDDFGGNIGVTIREFVRSERYTGFTKAGTRIPADRFKQFKDAINMIDEIELMQAAKAAQASKPAVQEKIKNETSASKEKPSKAKKIQSEDDEAAM